ALHIAGADALFGIGIALWLIWGAFRASREAVNQLMDREWPERERQQFLDAAAEYDELRGLHDLRTRKSGTLRFVQFHVCVPGDSGDVDFELRWFTPTSEVELCGHATLAAGHVLMTGHPVRFATKSGILTVTRRDALLELDLPAATLNEVHEPELCRVLGLP